MMKMARVSMIVVFAGIVSLVSQGRGYGQDKAEYDKLKKQYDAVVFDRDNILAQSKRMFDCNQRFGALEISSKAIQDERDKLKNSIQKAQDDAAQATRMAAEVKAEAEDRVKESEDKANQLVQENNKLKNSLEKVEIEYKILPETKREISRLQSEKKDLVKKNAQFEVRVKRLESERLDREAQVEVFRKQIVDFKKKYEKAMVKNRLLEKKADQLPVKFAEMARENKVLLKETALMHYNLGVFYTKNKEFARSIAEFEKAIELNPDDPYAYYNLGYIYAEYLVNRQKAIANFRKYLNLLKTDDKDSDWVKKYIITWQTWEGKKPME